MMSFIYPNWSIVGQYMSLKAIYIVFYAFILQKRVELKKIYIYIWDTTFQMNGPSFNFPDFIEYII